MLIKGLPKHADEILLKKAAQIKHVISVKVDHDSITNDCLGTGRVKLRLSPEEDIENVKMGYVKEGYSVVEYQGDMKKKSAFTQEMRTMSPQKKFETDARMARIQNLASGSPEIFGNDSKAKNRFE